jgi:hypothetical protein
MSRHDGFEKHKHAEPSHEELGEPEVLPVSAKLAMLLSDFERLSDGFDALMAEAKAGIGGKDAYVTRDTEKEDQQAQTKDQEPGRDADGRDAESGLGCDIGCIEGRVSSELPMLSS